MSRITKTIGFSVSPPLVREVNRLAKEERRTKSELFREMLRVYRRYRKQRDFDDERWVMQLIEEAKKEQEERPMSVEEMLAEDERLARYGARRARQLGIGTSLREIDRIIHAFRRQHRA